MGAAPNKNYYEESECSMAKDFQFFIDNLSKLYSDYADKFVAIKDGTLLGVYDSQDEAVFETAKTEPMGTFIVQKTVSSIDEITAHYAGSYIL